MRIKTIQAKSFRQALSIVKKEMGDDAVILSSEDRKEGRPFVEVTAAVDHEVESAPVAAGHNAEETAPEQPPVSAGSTDEISDIKNEIMNLKQCIQSMRNTGFEMKLPEGRKRLYDFLKGRSIKDEFAYNLIERAASTDDLQVVMSKDINASTLLGDMMSEEEKAAYEKQRKIVMLIGPTGVGKTTTVAKLASDAIREGKKVGLISLDSFKIGAAEQIRIYARMIGIPLDIVSNKEGLIKSLHKFSDRDVVLIDTTGQNPRDIEYINRLKDIYSTGLPMETQLLLSTSSDGEFLMETHKHYGPLPISSIAFTKTDEAVRLGSIYNLCRLYRKPVAYVTNGQGVPGNIEYMDSNKLTNLILRTGSA